MYYLVGINVSADSGAKSEPASTSARFRQACSSADNKETAAMYYLVGINVSADSGAKSEPASTSLRFSKLRFPDPDKL